MDSIHYKNICEDFSFLDHLLNATDREEVTKSRGLVKIFRTIVPDTEECFSETTRSEAGNRRNFGIFLSKREDASPAVGTSG